MATNAERQASFKTKMRQAGKKQVTLWVDPTQQAAIKTLLINGETLPVTIQPLRITRSGKKKKRDNREAWQIANDDLWITHKREIEQRRQRGEKPSIIATWLNTLGFAGDGATLNGYLKQ
jgi:hypothetical protein